MAACTELEIEEKSSDESSHSIVHAKDSTFYNPSSDTNYNSAWKSKVVKELGAQFNVESETGDLKELSDDEFLHLLKEASTFNKPNNEESILLKQLRKEVADSDTCENVGRSESGCVSKRVDRKCSKLLCNSSESSTVSSQNSGLDISTSSLPARTFKQIVPKNVNDESAPVLLSVHEGPFVKRSQVSHHIVEIEANNNQWCLKPLKISESSECNSLPLQALSNSLDSKKQWQDGEKTSNILPNRFLRDFNLQHLDQNNSLDRDDDASTMVKLEKDQTSIVVVGGFEAFVKEQRMDNNHLASNLSFSDTQEIELIEIRHSKDIPNMKHEDQNSDVSLPLDKRQNAGSLGNSKFYVNCNDVDSTVTFPHKLTSSSVNDRNGSGTICDTVGDQLKRQENFPCFSWQRAQQVHSFLGSFPMYHETLQSPTTLVDYSGSSLLPDGPSSKLDWNHRKHKRAKNNADNCRFVLAENIAGHRGNEDIDSLVKFIEEADKNNKVFARNSSSNQIFKNSSTQDTLKKKMLGKDSKLAQSKNGSSSKKKLSVDDNSNLGDGNKGDNSSFECKAVSSESESSDDLSYQRAVKALSVESEASNQCLDINSNVMEPSCSSPDQEVTAVKVNENYESFAVSITPPKVDSPIPDSQYVTEVLPQPAVEESGFRIVKKKQRKRHQGKRSENSRWRSAAARVRQSGSGDHDYYSKDEGQNSMMLLSNMSQRKQCGKQDSRRKSTSSVPHSEQSSADNSDLDSVHSLPVRGSAPHPTKTHPHTTPSSYSSTPQASYADIARMPVSSVSKQAASGSSISSLQQSSLEAGAAPEPLEPSANVGEISDPSAMKNVSHLKNTREINTQTEPLSLSEENSLWKSDIVPFKSVQCSFNERRSSLQCLCKGKNCSCSKLIPTKQNSLERLQRPAVVMMGNIPMMEASDISFGIDIKEILQISASDESDVISHLSTFSDTANRQAMQLDSFCPKSEDEQLSSANSSSNDSHCDASEQVNVVCKKSSSPCQEIYLSSGQRLKFINDNIDSQQFNYSQVVGFLAQEWDNIEKEFNSEKNKCEEKVKYYSESC